MFSVDVTGGDAAKKPKIACGASTTAWSRATPRFEYAPGFDAASDDTAKKVEAVVGRAPTRRRTPGASPWRTSIASRSWSPSPKAAAS